MQTTESSSRVSQRTAPELLEDLCLALKAVGIATQFLPYAPPDPDVERAVKRVQRIDSELHSRGVEPTERLAMLTQETHWMMPELRRECLGASPRPWVRDARNGLRIAMRCTACREAEFPADARNIRLCGSCLTLLDKAIATRAPREDLLLYRTFNPQARCGHADHDTVLGVYPWSAELGEGFPIGLCRVCIAEEVQRRKSRVGAK